MDKITIAKAVIAYRDLHGVSTAEAMEKITAMVDQVDTDPVSEGIPDYPNLYKRRLERQVSNLESCLAFFASSIKSGERWSDLHVKFYEMAKEVEKDPGRAVATLRTGPSYYVRHPGNVYTLADPQPISP
jgi:hypothetical protein